MNNITIDHSKCMSRKNKRGPGANIQCSHAKKVGDYCGIHSKCKVKFRIDQPQYQNMHTKPNTQINKKKSKPGIDNDDMSDDDDSSIDIKNIHNAGIYNIPKIPNPEKAAPPCPPKAASPQKMELARKYAIKEIKLISLIQSKYRKKFLKKISGPAYENRLLSHDAIDPISQESLWQNNNKISYEIPKELLFSYTDNLGNIKCFNIKSLDGLFHQNIFTHPITGEKFPDTVIKNAMNKIKVLKLIGLIEEKQQTVLNIKDMTFDVLFKFSKYNIYLKDEWFLDLSLAKLHKMYYETKDFFEQNVWDRSTFKHIFEKSSDIIKGCHDLAFVRYYILDNFNKILMSDCKNESLKTLAVYTLLGGFATVCQEVKQGYPDILFNFI